MQLQLFSQIRSVSCINEVLFSQWDHFSKLYKLMNTCLWNKCSAFTRGAAVCVDPFFGLHLKVMVKGKWLCNDKELSIVH